MLLRAYVKHSGKNNASWPKIVRQISLPWKPTNKPGTNYPLKGPTSALKTDTSSQSMPVSHTYQVALAQSVGEVHVWLTLNESRCARAMFSNWNPTIWLSQSVIVTKGSRYWSIQIIMVLSWSFRERSMKFRDVEIELNHEGGPALSGLQTQWQNSQNLWKTEGSLRLWSVKHSPITKRHECKR